MRQRGRKSQASLAVLPVENIRHQLQPPDHLSAKEAALFREVLLSAPADQFSLADQYLLATFCQITCLIRTQARTAAKAKKESRQGEFKLLFEACKTQSLIATKLRLTTHSRIVPHVAGRAHDKHRPPSIYEAMRLAGWES